MKKGPMQNTALVNELMLKDATENILERFKKMTPKFDKVLSYVQKSYNIFVEKVQASANKKVKQYESELMKSK
jgi:hypothetical protein